MVADKPKPRNWPDRWLVPAYVCFIVIGSLIWPVFIKQGWLDAARIGICLFFLVGAATMVIGYLRYMEWSIMVPSLLLLSFGKAIASTALGGAFFLLEFYGYSQQSEASTLLLIYALFGAAASTMLFTGLFLFFGAQREWILRDVYWLPWLGRDRSNK